MAFFENLWNFLKELQPLRIVHSFEQGVYFRNGQISRWVVGAPDLALPPGVYAVIPFFDDIEKVNTQEDTIDLPIQTLTTKDGKTVTLSWNVEFQVVNVVQHFMAVRDFDENMPRRAARHIASRVRNKTLDELINDQKELEDSLKGTLNTKAKTWGVKILDAGLTDIVQAKPYRFIGGMGI